MQTKKIAGDYYECLWQYHLGLVTTSILFYTLYTVQHFSGHNFLEKNYLYIFALLAELWSRIAMGIRHCFKLASGLEFITLFSVARVA